MEDKFYLTKQGLEKIETEYLELKKIKASKIKGETPPILHSEDLNPEYIAFREDLSFLENRINEIQYILKNVELIKNPPKNKRNIIDLGAIVTLEENGGQIDQFMIVGTLEANPAEGRISSESPTGKVVLGKKIGDEIVISSPTKMTYRIKKIKYNLS